MSDIWLRKELVPDMSPFAILLDQAVSKLPDNENPPVNTPSVVCKWLAATLYLSN